MKTVRHPRQDIHYWKCDRPAAFHGLQGQGGEPLSLEQTHALVAVLAESLGGPVELHPGGGQGNHQTFRAKLGSKEVFVRVENGPESDDYMEVEAHLLREIARLGVPAPAVLAVDASRRRLPFAWQVLEYIPDPDLNRLHKEKCLNLPAVMFDIGAAVARWQALVITGYGPFEPGVLLNTGQLRGFHDGYADYFRTRLDLHFGYLTDKGFLTSDQVREIAQEIDRHAQLLALERSCLVHKDLALWNILGKPGQITAFIDWDDAVGGDPMDDLSLLACFHDGTAIERAIEGFVSIRPLPQEHCRRFWLHLLRNLIFKAVIRVGAGYFDRTDGFFLIGAGDSGAGLRRFTLARIDAALQGLRRGADPFVLS
ncbi:MAG: aminoglycoside phosphotransferase family protein [Opitutaceae bacterium]|nr:aminoglycoside phosphotransferase family protein [Opitutaceae bacterium]